MVRDPDIQRGANRMIEHYDAHASAAAKARAAELFRDGETSAAEIWRQIATAIAMIEGRRDVLA